MNWFLIFIVRCCSSWRFTSDECSYQWWHRRNNTVRFRIYSFQFRFVWHQEDVLTLLATFLRIHRDVWTRWTRFQWWNKEVIFPGVFGSQAQTHMRFRVSIHGQRNQHIVHPGTNLRNHVLLLLYDVIIGINKTRLGRGRGFKFGAAFQTKKLSEQKSPCQLSRKSILSGCLQ